MSPNFKAMGKVKDLLLKIKASCPIIAIFYKGPSYDELEGEDSIPQNWELIERVNVELAGTRGRTLLAYGLKDNGLVRARSSEKATPLSLLIEQFKINSAINSLLGALNG